MVWATFIVIYLVIGVLLARAAVRKARELDLVAYSTSGLVYLILFWFFVLVDWAIRRLTGAL